MRNFGVFGIYYPLNIIYLIEILYNLIFDNSCI